MKFFDSFVSDALPVDTQDVMMGLVIVCTLLLLSLWMREGMRGHSLGRDQRLNNVGNWSGNFDKHNSTRSDRDYNDKSLRAQHADPTSNAHYAFHDGTPEHFTNDTTGTAANWRPTSVGEKYRMTMADRYQYEAGMFGPEVDRGCGKPQAKGVAFSEDALVDYTHGDEA